MLSDTSTLTLHPCFSRQTGSSCYTNRTTASIGKNASSYKQKNTRLKGSSQTEAEGSCVCQGREQSWALRQSYRKLRFRVTSEREKLRFFLDLVTPKCGHEQLFNSASLCGWLPEQRALTTLSINNYFYLHSYFTALNTEWAENRLERLIQGPQWNDAYGRNCMRLSHSGIL